jgi:septal ring factor EnvC (AmiA/AmiB activator)
MRERLVFPPCRYRAFSNVLQALALALGLLGVVASGSASAGILIEPADEAAADLAELAAMQESEWTEERARSIARQVRLAGELRQVGTAIASNEQLLRRLVVSFVEIDEAQAALERRQAEETAELAIRRQRLEALLAEIVQLSRDAAAEPRRLAQLRALAGSLSEPFDAAKAALARTADERSELEARAKGLRHESLAARRARVTLHARLERLRELIGSNRQTATVIVARASAAERMADLLRSRAGLARDGRAVAAVRLMEDAVASREARGGRAQARPIGRGVLTARASASGPVLRAAAQVGVPGALVRAMPEGQVAPVSGAVLDRFGGSQKPPFDRGVTIEVDDRRLVRAPRDGRVVFARAYAGFGLLLIIDHGNEYHSLLSGLSHFVVQEGWTVRAGEMVGTLEPGTEGIGRLYLELRRHGIPIDPLAWYAAGQDKVRS